MNSTKQILATLVCLLLYVAPVVAQEPQPVTTRSGGEMTVSAAPETSVAGARFGKNEAHAAAPAINLQLFGTAGRIPKFGGGIFLVNSVITEDSNGRIGIGTTTPGSALTVAGQIETKAGGIKFPDGTVQLTSAAAALFQVSHDATLAGLGTTASPLSIANGGVTGPKIAAGQVVKSLNGLFDSVSLMAGTNITITPSGNGLTIAAPNLSGSVAHDGTLVGDGTGAMPLGVAIPLSLSGSLSFPASILEIVNNTGDGLVARGGDASSAAVRAFGGDGGNPFFSGAAVIATGGKRPAGTGGGSGGEGVIANGGVSENGNGGPGLVATGGAGSLGSRGGHGIVAFAGASPSGDGLAGLFFGNIENRSPGKGIILRSPDNLTCRLLTIDNAGALVLTAVTCP